MFRAWPEKDISWTNVYKYHSSQSDHISLILLPTYSELKKRVKQVKVNSLKCGQMKLQQPYRTFVSVQTGKCLEMLPLRTTTSVMRDKHLQWHHKSANMLMMWWSQRQQGHSPTRRPEWMARWGFLGAISRDWRETSSLCVLGVLHLQRTSPYLSQQ